MINSKIGQLFGAATNGRRSARIVTDGSGATQGARLLTNDVSPEFAESFRLLAFNLSALHARGAGMRSLLVASAFHGDGRSLTTANLAIALAGEGASVMVVVADGRRPGLGVLLQGNGVASPVGPPSPHPRVVPTGIAGVSAVYGLG